MISLDFKDGRPLYEQIKEKIKYLIIRGVWKPDDRVPSVREMAQELTINPNTIQKAYKDLEVEGFIYSLPGKGSFVSGLDEGGYEARKEDLLYQFKRITLELKYLKVAPSELGEVIKEVYGDDGTDTFHED